MQALNRASVARLATISLLLLGVGSGIVGVTGVYALALLVEPVLHFALEPLTLLDVAIFVREETESVLLTVAPGAIVLAAVLPDEHAMALLAIVSELSFVRAAIVPPKDAPTVHLIGEPFAFVTSTI